MNPCPECRHPRSYHTIKHDGCRQCGCSLMRSEIPRGLPVDATAILTPLGAIVAVRPAPAHLGDGVLLTAHMQAANDIRRFEVYLSPKNAAELKGKL